MDELAGDFQRYFEIVAANTPALRSEVFRLRYQVYAQELGWEQQTQFPNGEETDINDPRSAFCLLRHRASQRYIGCVRLVMVDPDVSETPFPFEVAAQVSADELAASYTANWREVAGEISRVAVISDFRRRTGERNAAVTDVEEDTNPARPERRGFPHIAVGLYLGAAVMGTLRGLERVFALMEPKLARRLRAYGIVFNKIGEAVDHHGLRVPYCLEGDSFEGHLSPQLLEVLQIIQRDLLHSVPTDPG